MAFIERCAQLRRNSAVARQVRSVCAGHDGAYGALVHARLLALEHVVDGAGVLRLLGEAPPAHRLVRVGVGDKGPPGRRGAQLDNVGLGDGRHPGDLVEPGRRDRPRKVVHDERPREGAVGEEEVARLFLVGDELYRLVHARRPEPGRRQGGAKVLLGCKVHGLFDVVVGAAGALGDGLAVDGRDAQAPFFLKRANDADELPEHAVLFALRQDQVVGRRDPVRDVRRPGAGGGAFFRPCPWRPPCPPRGRPWPL